MRMLHQVAAREFEAVAGSGTYVAWRVERTSAEMLRQWAQGLGVPEIVDPSEMHATVMYSPSHSLWDDSLYGESKLEPPWRVSPYVRRTLRRFGKDGAQNCLVVAFSCLPMEREHRMWASNGLMHTFADYEPHVTISYAAEDFPERAMEFPPHSPIDFDRRTIEPCKTD